ncbi:C4-dicarboxylate ABC transporter permease [Falsiroseomonas bella]|uniref:TRAP transporter small permease protein n=1 Tax=Falsiroseomonas bella TaxID=2184016 RepID=A0A317F6E3_9PROT|nr:TRAP transporter small permease subunit [Falsiroseomonas bella]PWS34112.1 C4-dicarboxylate ABC transporter permease [Falsiroseomonas bella]
MWLALAVVLAQFVVVVLRYAFASSFVWMQESVIYLHATLFMLAIGYTYLVDQHVRVDVLYAGWSMRKKAAVDLVSIVVAVLPFCALVVWGSWGYAAASWRQDEGPMAYGGVPLVPALKSLIPLMAILLAAQAVSIAIRCIAVLTGAASTHFPYRAHQGSA